LKVENEKFDYKPIVFKNGKVVPEKKVDTYHDPSAFMKEKQKDIAVGVENAKMGGAEETNIDLDTEPRNDVAFTISRYGICILC